MRPLSGSVRSRRPRTDFWHRHVSWRAVWNPSNQRVADPPRVGSPCHRGPYVQLPWERSNQVMMIVERGYEFDGKPTVRCSSPLSHQIRRRTAPYGAAWRRTVPWSDVQCCARSTQTTHNGDQYCRSVGFPSSDSESDTDNPYGLSQCIGLSRSCIFIESIFVLECEILRNRCCLKLY